MEGDKNIWKSDMLELEAAFGKRLIYALLAFGSRIEVLEPREVVKELQEEVDKIGRLYSNQEDT